jgi:hypothetical protein
MTRGCSRLDSCCCLCSPVCGAWIEQPRCRGEWRTMKSPSSAVVPRLILLAVRVTRNSLQNSGTSFSFHSFTIKTVCRQFPVLVLRLGFCNSGFWQHICLVRVHMRQHRAKLILSLVESRYISVSVNIIARSQNTVVGIMTRLWAGWSRVTLLPVARYFSLLQNLGSSQSHIHWIHKGKGALMWIRSTKFCVQYKIQCHMKWT